MSGITGLSSSSYGGTETPGLPPQQPEDLPKASIEALEFINDIKPEDFKHLLFSDTLATVSELNKELGEFTVTISATKYNGEECMLVHANSHGAIENVPCGTSITAYVTDQLQTLEQQHHEYVKLENHPLDRKTLITKADGTYVVNRTISQGDDVQRTAQTFNVENMEGFISEGSNLLLQRLLVRKGIPINCQLVALDSDSRLCPVLYSPLERRAQVVQEEEIEVYGLERTINSLSDLPTTWQAYFSKDGHMTSRVQVGSPVTMRLLVMPPPCEDEPEDEKPTFGKKELSWEDDLEMNSLYITRKDELKDMHAKYMREHPELKALMGDFLQHVLLRKPKDTIKFAAEYFSAFYSRVPDTTAYLESAAPTPFPNSRSNTKIQFLTRTS